MIGNAFFIQNCGAVELNNHEIPFQERNFTMIQQMKLRIPTLAQIFKAFVVAEILMHASCWTTALTYHNFIPLTFGPAILTGKSPAHDE